MAAGTHQRLSFVQSVGDLVHDANGSLTQSGTRTFGFNTANQPISLGDGTNSVSYQYGPDRNRLSKLETLSGKTWDTLYVHPGFERTRQTASNGSIVTEDRYALYAGNRLVGTRIKLTTDGVVTRRAEYYHEDALGSVEVITDSIGRILRRYQYDPFGARTDITALSIYEAGLVRIVEDDPNTALNEKDVFNTLMVKGYTGHEHMDGVWPGCGVTLSHSAVSQTRA